PIAPLLWKYREIHAAYHLQRGGGEIDAFGADLTSFLDSSPLVAFWNRLSILHRPEGELFPGLTAVVLVAIAGCVWIRRAPRAAGSRRHSAAAPVRWLPPRRLPDASRTDGSPRCRFGPCRRGCTSWRRSRRARRCWSCRWETPSATRPRCFEACITAMPW